METIELIKEKIQNSSEACDQSCFSVTMNNNQRSRWR